MSKNSLDLYRIGSKVKLTDDVIGNIVSITIHGDNHVSYQCGWWNGRSYCTESFHASEVEITTSEKTKIGFA